MIFVEVVELPAESEVRGLEKCVANVLTLRALLVSKYCKQGKRGRSQRSNFALIHRFDLPSGITRVAANLARDDNTMEEKAEQVVSY